MILSTMLVPVRPVRLGFDGPVYDVPSQRVLFQPSEGQPRMFRKVIRLPAGEIKASTQPGSGMGYFVTENVQEGQPITFYAQNEIPEWVAEILKNKVRSRLNIQ